MRVVLAINAGATTTRVALLSLTGELLAQRKLGTLCHDYRGTLDLIKETAQSLLQTSPWLHELQAIGVCVACPLVDGTIKDTANMPDWADRSFLADLQAMFGVPVTALNDAKAEGSGEGADLYLSWGTGIGVSIFGKATELGHMTIDRNSDVQCGCGGYGHLEALVGGTNLPRRFGFPHGSTLTDEQWATVSDAQWEWVLDDLAIGLVNLALSSPGSPIVLGGGITALQLAPSGNNRLPRLQEMVNRRKTTIEPPRLVLAKHGEDSAIYGLAYAARQLVTAP